MPGHNEEKTEPPNHNQTSTNTIDVLLKYITNGNEDNVKSILTKNPGLAVAQSSINDCSNLYFHKISPIQYAWWAYDIQMVCKIVPLIPLDITSIALQQLDDLEKQGAKGKDDQSHGSHYDYSTLINTLDIYIKNYDSWDEAKKADHWCKQVGGAQRTLPAHVRQQYCHPQRSFCPIPSFAFQDNLPRIESKFFSRVTNEYLTWTCATSNDRKGLGFDFAVYRSPSMKNGACSPPIARAASSIQKETAENELNVLKFLFEKSRRQLKDIQLLLTIKVETITCKSGFVLSGPSSVASKRKEMCANDPKDTVDATESKHQESPQASMATNPKHKRGRFKKLAKSDLIKLGFFDRLQRLNLDGDDIEVSTTTPYKK